MESPIESQKMPEIEDVNKRIQNLIMKANANSVPLKKAGYFDFSNNLNSIIFNFLERTSATSFFFGFLANKNSVDKVVPTLTNEEEKLLRELKVLMRKQNLNENKFKLNRIDMIFWWQVAA